MEAFFCIFIFLAGLCLGLLLMVIFAKAPVVVVSQFETEPEPQRSIIFPLFIAALLGVVFLLAWNQWSSAAGSQQATPPLSATMLPVPPPSGLQGDMQPEPSGLQEQMLPQAATPIPQDDAAETKNRTGMDWLARGDCAAAEAWFQAAITADPDFYKPYNNLAFCFYERDDLAWAVVLWETALQLESQSADAHAGLATALWMLGQQYEAQQSYRRAVALDQRYSNADWMAQERFWSHRMLNDSQPLRGWLAAGMVVTRK
ncbi:MAG: hypothetical protein EI684_19665 [Candidatus Viridilinea halotolerans]|uniref:Uncharacterized protein n=1 Tax=Candidatus Viridilinea halotolerans TaxID=2491704 RepID=A0A426TSJ2_9CHLR|nr:MAG: hypothetical protein EI684_19665 [Candidatus Viridilinea halotolerans]